MQNAKKNLLLFLLHVVVTYKIKLIILMQYSICLLIVKKETKCNKKYFNFIYKIKNEVKINEMKKEAAFRIAEFSLNTTNSMQFVQFFVLCVSS